MGTSDKCDICWKQEALPFKCGYCGGTFCAEHRLPEKHGCTYDLKQNYREGPESPESIPSYVPEDNGYAEASPIRDNGRDRDIERRSAKVTGLLRSKMAIVLIVLCLILAIGYYSYSSHGNPYNAFVAPAVNACVSGVVGLVDPYYNTPYYVYVLKQSETINGQRTDEYQSYPNGSICYITNYKNATNPGYNELVKFLASDDTENQTYVENVYVCTNFAVRLHDNAEAHGIKAYIVTVDIEGAPTHMIDGFNTTDRGWVFIDDTGLTNEERLKGSPLTDTYVDLTPGESYVLKDIIPGASGNWQHESIGTIDSYKIWDWVENYGIWSSYQYK